MTKQTKDAAPIKGKAKEPTPLAMAPALMQDKVNQKINQGLPGGKYLLVDGDLIPDTEKS